MTVSIIIHCQAGHCDLTIEGTVFMEGGNISMKKSNNDDENNTNDNNDNNNNNN